VEWDLKEYVLLTPSWRYGYVRPPCDEFDPAPIGLITIDGREIKKLDSCRLNQIRGKDTKRSKRKRDEVRLTEEERSYKVAPDASGGSKLLLAPLFLVAILKIRFRI